MNWNNYYGIPDVQQNVWEDRAGNLVKAMLLLANSKHEAAKKGLSLVFSQIN